MNPTMFRVLLQILADRALLFVTLFLNFALFGYAVLYPDNLRFATAGLFSITCFYPVLRYSHDRKKSEYGQSAEQAA